LRLTRKLLAIAAGTVIAGGIAVAATGTADAATPSCGVSCVNVYSADFTNGITSAPSFVMDTYKRDQAAGTPVILFRTSNTDPALDFSVSDQGTVADFYGAGLVSPEVALHYGCVPAKANGHCKAGAVTYVDDYAYEIEYAPYGADTGLCVGVASAAVAGEKVTLQPCGVTSKTVWVVDSFDGPSAATTLTNQLSPLINGSDTNFSQPFVLTYPSSGYPTDQPRPQLYVTNITGSAAGAGPVEGTVSDAQLWSAVTGVLP
jgi:hypothetical protein